MYTSSTTSQQGPQGGSFSFKLQAAGAREGTRTAATTCIVMHRLQHLRAPLYTTPMPDPRLPGSLKYIPNLHAVGRV
jgi:hypothetical protein